MYRFTAFILAVFLALPSAYGQVNIASHNITFELQSDGTAVEEVIVFQNPETSEIHTYEGVLTLLRGNLEEISVSGVEAAVNNATFPTVILLDFSRNQIFRSATENKKTVILRYTTRDFTRLDFIQDEQRIYIFAGNAILPLPFNIEFGETNIKIRTREDFQFGRVIPQAQVVDGELIYRIPRGDRRTFNELIVEIQYGDFESLALMNMEEAEKSLENARIRGENAESVIINANIYDGDIAKAQRDLDNSRELVEESQNILKLADESLDKNEFYQAYVFTNTSLSLAEEAQRLSVEAEKEGSLQLRVSIGEKISRLENITASMQTPAPTGIPSEENRTPVTLPPETVPPTIEKPVETDRGLNRRILVGIGFIVLLGAVILSRKRRQKKGRLSAVKDFRAIADLKRKSYRGFEEKLLDVKKETTIAGEIRRLAKEREKYKLGIDNLGKRRLEGEIGDEFYDKEKKRFEDHITKLDKEISNLEREMPVKGGVHEKNSSDRSSEI